MRTLKHHWKLLLLASLMACNITTLSTPTPTIEPVLPQPTLPPVVVSTEAVAPPNPNCAATPVGWVPYTIEPGDSLGLLADQTSSTFDELAAGNCLVNPDEIFVGQVIYLPRQPEITQ